MTKYLLPIIMLLIIYACATVQQPVGGEKDVIPPQLYASTPKQQSLNFKGKEIKLFFNEWMKVENLQKELIITPRTNLTYKHLHKKQEITITLEEPLADSTTYTFNFRKSLKDITESNLWQDPILAFSTGSYMDSMKISGTVINLLDREPAKGFTVGLYDSNYDTANLRQGEPIYFTTTNENGEYSLQNLKPGQYLLYGFQDNNNNLINEPSSESYTFHASTLQLYDSIPQIELKSYKSNEDTLKLKKASASGSDFVINYNKGIQSYRITNINNPGNFVFANDEEAARNIRIYLSNFRNVKFETDSIPLLIEATDSLDNGIVDTVYAKFRESRIKSEELKILQMPTKEILTGPQKFTITFNKPIYTINTDSMYIKYDTVLIKNIQIDDIQLSTNKKSIYINTEIIKQQIDSIDMKRQQIRDSIASLPKDTTRTKQANDSTSATDKNSDNSAKPTQSSKENNQGERGASNKSSINGLHLYTGKGSFIGIESDTSASNHIVFQFKKEENYGIIKGNIVGDTTNYIIQLTNAKYEVVDTLYNRKNYIFNYVKPGDYYLRVIIDANGNKKWDPGRAIQLTPPEQIIYLNEKITVKANWEIIDKNIVLTDEKDVDKGNAN